MCVLNDFLQGGFSKVHVMWDVQSMNAGLSSLALHIHAHPYFQSFTSKIEHANSKMNTYLEQNLCHGLLLELLHFV